MRVRIIFKLKNRGGVLPFHHQHLLAQLIKGMIIKGGAEEYASFLDYNFSGLKGQTRVSRKGLHFFSSRVTLVFSSSKSDFIDYFTEILFQHPLLEVGNLELVPDKIEVEEKQVIGSPLKFVCISPLVLSKPVFGEKKTKRFIHPDTDDFSDLLFESTLARMSASGDFNEEDMEAFYQFQIVPDKKYLQKLDENQKKYARIYAVYDNDVK
ncbi:MAG: CRISPR-associated protein Cas6, partial [Cyclobacteriaceae bacterium]|nr:CRISPR-associated protein Cas6 [Cyclobacteriaceae bacterium]